MTDEAKPREAVEVAKEVKGREDGQRNILTLPDGHRARLAPVSAALIEEVTSRIKDPEPPTVYIEEVGREEPNPDDPKYRRELEEVGRKRGIAAMDAMVMFGVELLDGLPESDGWLKKLQKMEKMGHIDLSGYDTDDELDKEFLYKRFIVVDGSVITRISELSGMTGEEIERAESSFPGN